MTTNRKHNKRNSLAKFICGIFFVFYVYDGCAQDVTRSESLIREDTGFKLFYVEEVYNPSALKKGVTKSMAVETLSSNLKGCHFNSLKFKGEISEARVNCDSIVLVVHDKKTKVTSTGIIHFSEIRCNSVTETVTWKDYRYDNKEPSLPTYEHLLEIGPYRFRWELGEKWILADAFYSLMYISRMNQYKDDIVSFESIAANYRALDIKPEMSETQRMYVVQANACNEKKNYPKALELYTSAIEVDQTSYPEAYYNMALIAAINNDYALAIFNMKKYLMLVPDAEDARAAQDKIYEWEIELPQ